MSESRSIERVVAVELAGPPSFEQKDDGVIITYPLTDGREMKQFLLFQEFFELVDKMNAAAGRSALSDSMQEALNSGDGTYRP